MSRNLSNIFISAAVNPHQLEPLPYQMQLRDFLKTEEAEVWNWYASNRVREDQAESVRFELLKATYRVEQESQPNWYRAAERAAEKLSLDVPITIYQAQNPQGMNAGLAYLPKEAHVVLVGPVAEKLTEDELFGLFAHELSHLLLWQGWGGEFLIVDQILSALTNDRHAEPAHFASARLFDLYNEIFCDRAALQAVGDPLVVISGLVKVVTGLESVSAASYAKQADEIFSKQTKPSQNLTHPEAFIRARALRLWHEEDEHVEEKITEMIEGPPALEQLDLIGQRRVSQLTERILSCLLAHRWMQSDTILGHARLFFDDFSPPPSDHRDDRLCEEIKTSDQALIDYYCYVMLDLVTADRDLEEAPLAAALTLTESLELKDRFSEIARKELKLGKKRLDKLDQTKTDVLAQAAKERTHP